MGAIITHFNWQFTYGNKYERFTLTNLLNLKNSTEIKFSKDAGNSIFSSQHVNDENKEDIEKIYKFFDTNSNKDGNLTYQELYDGIEEAIIASMDKKQHVNVDKVNAFFKNNGIELKNPENFLAFIKAAEEFPDLSKDAQSGYYKIDDGFNTKYEVQKDESDLSGRTYKLKNPKDGKTILANFGGQPADTQKMVSEFYAKALNNPNLEIGKISFYKKGFGEVEGATIPDINPNKLNKSAKLGLDAFFSNNETKNHISYAGTLDQTSRGLNTSFSFIPYEFPKLTENNKYNRNDIISALKTISDISDEEIKSTLKKYNNTERYEDTLLKRKEFCKIMLEQAQNTKQKKNESIKDYVERLQIYTTGKILKNIDNPADLKAFTDSADSIEDANFKQSLQELIKIKENEIKQTTNETKNLKPLTNDDTREILKKYNYSIVHVDNKDINIYKREIDEEDSKYLSKKLGNGYTKYMRGKLSSSQVISLLTEEINKMQENNIDVLKDKEAFNDFMIFRAVMNLKSNTVIDKNTYEMVVNTTKRNMPNPQEQDAINFYKNDQTYLILHTGTDGLLKNDIEPIPGIKEKMEVLNNYLHKHKTKTDIHVYRGEHAGIFNGITMPDGTNLGLKLMELSQKIPKNGDIPPEQINEINEIIDYVNKNPFNIENTRFCSTSIDKSVADKFHEVGLDLNLPAGSSAACIDAVNFDGKESGEGEVLASYGSIEQITGAKFDPETRRITFTGKLITDTNK